MNDHGMMEDGYVYARDRAIERIGEEAFNNLTEEEQLVDIKLVYLAKVLVREFLERKKKSENL